MDKAPAIVGAIASLIIAILTAILLFKDYRDCFSKDPRVKMHARQMNKRQWLFILIIFIIAVLTLLGMISYLVFSSWDPKDFLNPSKS